jgi:hypothetical protein
MTPTDDEALRVRQSLLALRASNNLADRAPELLPDVERVERSVREVVEFICLPARIETTAPGGKLVFHIFGA